MCRNVFCFQFVITNLPKSQMGSFEHRDARLPRLPLFCMLLFLLFILYVFVDDFTYGIFCPGIQLRTSWRIHFEELCKSKYKSKCKSDEEINVRCYANRESKCKRHGKIDLGAMRMQMQIYPSGRLNVSSFS